MVNIWCDNWSDFTQGVYGGGNQRKTSGTLHLYNVTLEDDGIYVCVTHNPLLNISKRSRPAKLNVKGEVLFGFSSVFFIASDRFFVKCTDNNQHHTNSLSKKLYIHFTAILKLRLSFTFVNSSEAEILFLKSCFVRLKWYVHACLCGCGCFNVLPHRSPKKTTDHPWSRQHHCCSGNWGLHALHCQWLPCSHGALVQRRLPPDQLLSLVQPSQQWTAAHNHVWHLLWISFCFFHFQIVTIKPTFATWSLKLHTLCVHVHVCVHAGVYVCVLSGMWPKRMKAGITVRHSIRKSQSHLIQPFYFQLVIDHIYQYPPKLSFSS